MGPGGERRGGVAAALLSPAKALARLPSRIVREARDDRCFLLSILVGVGVASAVAWRYSQLWHVPGGDPGQWLLISHFYLGRGAPVYSHPVGYPPLFFLYLGAWVAVLGDLPGLLASISGIYLLLPPACYLFARELSGDRPRALLFSSIVATAQQLLEMSTWGAYPNLFSFLFLFPALHYAIQCWRRGMRGDFRKLGLFAGLVALSHALSAAVLAVAVLLLFSFGATVGGRAWAQEKVKHFTTGSLPVLLAITLPFIALQQARQDPFPEWVTDQPYPPSFLTFKLLYQKIDLTGQLAWLPEASGAQDPFLWSTVILVGSLLALTLRASLIARRARGVERATKAAALAARSGWWSPLLAPLLLALALLAAGADTNLHRISYYLVFAFAALVAWLVRVVSWGGLRPAARVGREEDRGSARKGRRAVDRIRPPAAAAVALAFMTLWISWAADVFEGNTRFNSLFQDPEDRELAAWVSASTRADAVLITTPESFKWLGGLTGRAAFSYQDPWNIFRPDERDLARVAYQVLNHHASLESGPLRVRVQAFSGPSELTPAVDWTDGIRHRGVQFPANGTELIWAEANESRSARLSEMSGAFASGTDAGALFLRAIFTHSGAGTLHLNLSLPAGSRTVSMSLEWRDCPGAPLAIRLLGQADAGWRGAWATNKTDGFSLYDSESGEEVLATFSPGPAWRAVVSGVEGKRTSVHSGFDTPASSPRLSATFLLPVASGAPADAAVLLTPRLVRSVGATHIVADAEGAAAWFIPSEYGYAKVFGNAKYAVFETGLSA